MTDQDRIKQLEAENADLKAKFKQFKQDVAYGSNEMKWQIKNLKSERDRLQAEFKKADMEVESLEIRFRDATAELNKLKATMSNQQIPQSCEVEETTSIVIENPIIKLEAEIAQLKVALGVLGATLENLGAYASTVRTDRVQGDFALQTLDWCEGLLEQVKIADDVLTKQPSPTLYTALMGCVEALKQAKTIISGEFCSHDGKCSTKQSCHCDFIVEAITFLNQAMKGEK